MAEPAAMEQKTFSSEVSGIKAAAEELTTRRQENVKPPMWLEKLISEGADALRLRADLPYFAEQWVFAR